MTSPAHHKSQPAASHPDHTARDVFVAHMRDLGWQYGRMNTLLDIAETKAAAIVGRRVMDDETTLALETALIPYR